MSGTGDHPYPDFGLPMRSEFLLRDDVTFLNHASYGGTPARVLDRQIQYLHEMESDTDMWFRFNSFRYLSTAVQKVAEFMGVNEEDTVLMQNVTKATNNILKMFPLQSGDAILITTLTYFAVRNTAHAAAERVQGTKVHTLDIQFPIQSEDEVVKIYEDFLAKHPEVKIAVVDHITSPTSVVLPVKRLVDVCHRYDVIVAVDGAHAPGVLDVDIDYLDADFYTGDMQKWMYSPKSCAFLWMNPRRRYSWFKPLVTSFGVDVGLNTAFAHEGTLDITPYLCAADGIDFYNYIGGMRKIIGYTSDLLRKGVSYLTERWNTRPLDVPASMVVPTMQMVYLPPLPKYSHFTNKELILLLAERFKIQVPVEDMEGGRLVRVSTNVYNTMDDFVRLADVVLILARE